MNDYNNLEATPPDASAADVMALAGKQIADRSDTSPDLRPVRYTVTVEFSEPGWPNHEVSYEYKDLPDGSFCLCSVNFGGHRRTIPAVDALWDERFTYITREVEAVSGDGRGYVYFRRTPVSEAAGRFEAWLQAHKHYSRFGYDREDREDGSAHFVRGQESISFYSRPHEGADRSSNELYLEVD